MFGSGCLEGKSSVVIEILGISFVLFYLEVFSSIFSTILLHIKFNSLRRL